MKRFWANVHAAWILAAAGCGSSVVQPETVAIDKVPPAVMKTARERLPGYTITRAYRKFENGKDVFELLARDNRGKLREVEVTPAGEFVAEE
jgi:hypothetical protein